MANSVNPDQTAPIGAVCSGSTLFASILVKMLINLESHALFGSNPVCPLLSGGLHVQGSHRPENYLNIQGCLEKSLKIRFALNST